MVRWICSAKLCEKIPMSDLITRVLRYLGISNIKNDIRYNHLRWFSHLQHMDEEKWPRKILNFEVNGSYPKVTKRKDGLATLEVTLINFIINFFGTRSS